MKIEKVIKKYIIYVWIIRKFYQQLKSNIFNLYTNIPLIYAGLASFKSQHNSCSFSKHISVSPSEFFLYSLPPMNYPLAFAYFGLVVVVQLHPKLLCFYV